MEKASKRRYEIPGNFLTKWQKSVDLMAKLFEVPAGLIMRVNPPHIEVLVASRTEGNPYTANDTADLGTGLYCETVMAKKEMLHVPNALKDPLWDKNPDIKLDMIMYLGIPLIWPDGGVFGTICVLDRKNRRFGSIYIDLLYEFKMIVETDFQIILQQNEIHRANMLLEKRIAERTRELVEKKTGLEEANTALKVLLNHREEAKEELAENVASRINYLIVPSLKRLKNSGMTPAQSALLRTIDKNLIEITKPLSIKLSSKYPGITPREFEVAALIAEGKTSDQIADLLHVSNNAVVFHRQNLRRKLGLKGKKQSLRDFLAGNLY